MFDDFVDTLEELVCEEDEETTISCSAYQSSISIIPGTFYGIANNHACNGSKVSIPKKCDDKEVPEEAKLL